MANVFATVYDFLIEITYDNGQVVQFNCTATAEEVSEINHQLTQDSDAVNVLIPSYYPRASTQRVASEVIHQTVFTEGIRAVRITKSERRDM